MIRVPSSFEGLRGVRYAPTYRIHERARARAHARLSRCRDRRSTWADMSELDSTHRAGERSYCSRIGFQRDGTRDRRHGLRRQRRLGDDGRKRQRRVPVRRRLLPGEPESLIGRRQGEGTQSLPSVRAGREMVTRARRAHAFCVPVASASHSIHNRVPVVTCYRGGSNVRTAAASPRGAAREGEIWLVISRRRFATSSGCSTRSTSMAGRARRRTTFRVLTSYPGAGCGAEERFATEDDFSHQSVTAIVRNAQP